MKKDTTKKDCLILLHLLIIISSSCLLPTNGDEPINATTLSESLKQSNYYDTNPYDNIINQSNILNEKTYSEVSMANLFNITSSGKYFDGYNIFSILPTRINDSDPNLLITQELAITDMEGRIINKAKLRALFDLYNSTTLLGRKGDDFTVLWNFVLNRTQAIGPVGHHEIEYNPNNHSYFTFTAYLEDINGILYEFDEIVEYNFAGEEIWSVDTHSFISHTQWCPYKDIVPESGAAMVTHSNSIFYDPDEDVLYVHVRNVNTFYKINHKTKEIIWALGEYGNFTLFDIKGDQKDNLFYHAHAVEEVDENTFILFDNDVHNQSDSNNKRSQVIEITINTTTMTANETWKRIFPRSYFSPVYGDADRLPNGNRLVTFGGRHSSTSDVGARLVEVNETGNIVWEMNFPKNDYEIGVYRADRIHFAPIISNPQDIEAISTEKIKVSWQTWYNFRTNREMVGSFALFLDGIKIDNDLVYFKKYWYPTIINCSLEQLEKGNHNLTLIITDEGGHETYDSINITVKDFYLNREGIEEFEKGRENITLQWVGDTITSLQAYLMNNNTEEKSFIWDGSDIEYDLSSLEIGSHNITLTLINDSNPVYNDSLWVHVYSQSPPKITSFPENNILKWNTTILFSWDIFDHSPSTWEIFINNTRIISGYWKKTNYLLEWSLPVLDEGFYNITLVVIDLLNQKSSASSWITIEPPHSPIIAVIPSMGIIQWKKNNISLVWEVHGGSLWELWRNGSLFDQGSIKNNRIVVQIENWYSNNWLPGIYNITIKIVNETGGVSVDIIWLQIIVNLGDIYVDAFITENSIWYQFGENVLGSPDFKFALIFVDYGNGYLTLDMGLNEEIIDGNGLDFAVIASGGEYTVRVSNSLSSLFEILGTGTGNKSFDLSVLDLTSARYVQIEYRSGETIELDAIIAINYNQPEYDAEPPQIRASNWVWVDQGTVKLTWETYDLTPWKYSILVDNTLVEQNPWVESLITSILDLTDKSGIVEITLILDDIFGNTAEDTVTIEIRSRTTISETSYPQAKKSGYPFITFLGGFLLILILRKKNH